MRRGAYPLCFTSRRQYELWVAMAHGAEKVGSSYCVDCTPAYQQQMVAASRCAHPNTKFDLDADGFIEGQRPLLERLRRTAA